MKNMHQVLLGFRLNGLKVFLAVLSTLICRQSILKAKVRAKLYSEGPRGIHRKGISEGKVKPEEGHVSQWRNTGSTKCVWGE